MTDIICRLFSSGSKCTVAMHQLLLISMIASLGLLFEQSIASEECQFWIGTTRHISKDDTECCRPLIVPPGYQPVICISRNTSASFESCLPPTFQSESHSSSEFIYCERHTVCSAPNLVTVKNGTATSNTVCECNKAKGYRNTEPQSPFQPHYCIHSSWIDSKDVTLMSPETTAEHLPISSTYVTTQPPHDPPVSKDMYIGVVVGLICTVIAVIIIIIIVIIMKKRSSFRQREETSDRSTDIENASASSNESPSTDLSTDATSSQNYIEEDNIENRRHIVEKNSLLRTNRDDISGNDSYPLDMIDEREISFGQGHEHASAEAASSLCALNEDRKSFRFQS